jgi:hypothetical protein
MTYGVWVEEGWGSWACRMWWMVYKGWWTHHACTLHTSMLCMLWSATWQVALPSGLIHVGKANMDARLDGCIQATTHEHRNTLA